MQRKLILLSLLAIGLLGIIVRAVERADAPAADGEFGRRTSFISWRQVPFGRQSMSIDSADFNHDGYPDLVIDNLGVVELLLNDQKGNFSPPLLHRRGGFGAFRHLIARDLNDDGNADVAMSYQGSGDVWVFLGDGLGGLSQGVSVATGGPPNSLAAADVDGNGTLDIVVALAGTVESGGIGAVQVLLDDGHAVFASGAIVTAGIAPARIAVGDFDADGHPDVAVTNQYVRRATVMFNGSTGIFGNPVELKPVQDRHTPGPWGIAAGDLNGDGIHDLIIANGLFDILKPAAGQAAGGGGASLESNSEYHLSFGNAALFISTGQRGFTGPTFLPADSVPRDFRLIDFNGDGRRDIVSAGLVGIVPLIARGDSSFARFGPTGGSGFTLATADFNGDGLIDVAMDGGGGPRADLSLRLPDGTLPQPYKLRWRAGAGWCDEPVCTPIAPAGAAAADVNGDGILDLLTTTGSGGRLVTFLGRGEGNFDPPIDSATGGLVQRLAVADFTGDGVADAVVTSSESGDDALVLVVLRGDGQGHFERVTRLRTADAEYGRIAVADFDGDGAPDIAAVARRFGEQFAGAEVFLNAGAGQFDPAAGLPTGKVTLNALAGDLNRDGAIDLVLVNTQDLCVYLGHGDGTFADALTVPVTREVATSGGNLQAALGDLNEDRVLDLVVSHSINGTKLGQPYGTLWLRGDGTGRFVDPVQLAPEHVGLQTQDSFIGGVLAADFNADGHLDIAQASFGGVTVFEGNGRGAFAPFLRYFAMPIAGDGSCCLTAADFNGDGLIDLTTPFAGSEEVIFTLLFNDTHPEQRVPGDANCDARLTGADVSVLTRRLFSELYFPACGGADANADGSISVADVTASLKEMSSTSARRS
ncbi:MAG: VCBS repeat-containing protein [Deltaproteobacteria bacterium]|nr:VCBS repeat-containing protein [Deltaproteobacteria bacterium]